MENNFINLDCTFRDGGYHNNWNFKKPLIEKYLKCMSKLKINFIELGFRFLNRNKSRTHFAKAYGILYSILNLKSNYRPKIKK